MTTVTISPTFQVVIPIEIRDRLQLQPGQKMRVKPHVGRIELVLIRPHEELRGFLSGIDTSVDRDEDRM